jgi:hypothetical protein
MPHRSRLTGFVIDCEGDDLEAYARFWGAALGREVDPPEPGSPTYRSLKMRPEDPQVFLQKVDHPSRVHLDIEAEDIEAEVERLEKLGAKRIGKVKTWWVMEAPSGHRFCVVRLQRGPIDQTGNEWP